MSPFIEIGSVDSSITIGSKMLSIALVANTIDLRVSLMALQLLGLSTSSALSAPELALSAFLSILAPPALALSASAIPPSSASS